LLQNLLAIRHDSLSLFPVIFPRRAGFVERFSPLNLLDEGRRPTGLQPLRLIGLLDPRVAVPRQPLKKPDPRTAFGVEISLFDRDFLAAKKQGDPDRRIELRFLQPGVTYGQDPELLSGDSSLEHSRSSVRVAACTSVKRKRDLFGGRLTPRLAQTGHSTRAYRGHPYWRAPASELDPAAVKSVCENESEGLEKN
jgi:hypothetical protein